jgi:predicted CDP-diglyceride synthetase/phosphatidate cytidylyltransferase
MPQCFHLRLYTTETSDDLVNCYDNFLIFFSQGLQLPMMYFLIYLEHFNCCLILSQMRQFLIQSNKLILMESKGKMTQVNSLYNTG